MKEKCTMRYDVRTVTLRGFQLTFSTCERRIKTIISIPEFFTERYPDSEGWKLKGANIGMDRKGRVFVNLIYECPDPVIEENKDGKIVGLDRGVYNIVTTSEGVHYGAEDVRRVKRKYNHVRSVLQKSGCEKRFVHDQNHCISKKLANTDENVSVYVLEDLTSMNMLRLKGKSNKTMRKWLSGWSYSDLEEKLTYKCKRNGIRGGGICGCTLYEPEVFGVQDDRQGFEEREQIHMQALRQQDACRRKCRHQHPRQLHYSDPAIRAGCSQSAVWMGCHRQTGNGVCG